MKEPPCSPGLSVMLCSQALVCARPKGRVGGRLEGVVPPLSLLPSLSAHFTALTTQELSSEHADMPSNLQPEVTMDGGYEKTL